MVWEKGLVLLSLPHWDVSPPLAMSVETMWRLWTSTPIRHYRDSTVSFEGGVTGGPVDSQDFHNHQTEMRPPCAVSMEVESGAIKGTSTPLSDRCQQRPHGKSEPSHWHSSNKEHLYPLSLGGYVENSFWWTSFLASTVS